MDQEASAAAGEPAAMQHQLQQRLQDAGIKHTLGDDKSLTAQMFKDILNEQLGPIKRDIQAIKTHGVSHEDLTSMVGPLKKDIEFLTARVATLEMEPSRPTSARSDATEGTVTQQKLNELEHEIQQLKRQHTPRSSTSTLPADCDKRGCTAVFGNLDGFDMFHTASAWLRDKLSQCAGPQPHNSYMKGDNTSILFVEFHNSLDRDTAVALIRSAALKHNGRTIRASPDRPPTERA